MTDPLLQQAFHCTGTTPDAFKVPTYMFSRTPERIAGRRAVWVWLKDRGLSFRRIAMLTGAGSKGTVHGAIKHLL